MTDLNSLSDALESHFDEPWGELPDSLRKRVLQDFPLPWDKCSHDQRRSLAIQIDALYSGTGEEQDQISQQQFIDRKLDIENQIKQWMFAETPTAGDLAAKEKRLAELQQELAPMLEQLARGDYPELSEVILDEVPDNKESGNALACFQEMHNLTANEMSISFVGDNSEVGMGANNMLEISARTEKRRVALAALDLVDRRRGELNTQGAILLGLCSSKKIVRNDRTATHISRLRKVFKNHLGISRDPFYPYSNSAGWLPLFSLDDKRGAADERARREAEFRTISYEQMLEDGAQFGANEQRDPSENFEDDAAAKWLKENDLED